MRIAYVRVSSKDQNPERQLQGISNADKTYTEYASGKDMERPQLQSMISFARDGDTVVVYSMDRLARSLSDLLKTVDLLTKKGVGIEFVKEKIRFGPETDADPMNKLILSITGAFSEMERSLIRERQAEGIAIAKANGRYRGRARTITDEQLDIARELIIGGVPKAAVARRLGISRHSLYRYKL